MASANCIIAASGSGVSGRGGKAFMEEDQGVGGDCGVVGDLAVPDVAFKFDA